MDFITSLKVIWLGVVVVALGGWISNIVKLIDSDFARFTGLLVCRCIGVFIAPLGAVLGFV